MRACSKSNIGKTKTSGFSLSALTNANGQNDNQNNDEYLPEEEQSMSSTSLFKVTFVISFTALKIILLRGHAAFDDTKKLWLQTALFAQQTLSLGEALSKTRGRKGGNAIPSSPQFPLSPDINSPEVFMSNYTTSFETVADHQSTFSGNVLANDQSSSFDYARWAFLEFVVCYKQPLLIYMRTFVHQKLYEEASTNMRQHSPRRADFFRQASADSGSPLTDLSLNRMHRWKSWGGPSPSPPNIHRSPSSLLSASGSEPDQWNAFSLPSPASPRSPVAASNGNLSPALGPTVPPTLSPIIPDISDHHRSDFRRPSHGSAANSSNYSHIPLSHADQYSKQAAMQSQAASSFAHVQRFMGYQVTNTSEAFPQLTVWSKPFALEKLINEWKFVTQTYPNVFYLNEEQKEM
jgi:hypothetical protein